MIPGVTSDKFKIGPGKMIPIKTFDAGKRVEISAIGPDGSGTIHGTILSGDKNQIKVVTDSGLLMVDHPMGFRDSKKSAPESMLENLKKWATAKDAEIENCITMNMVAFEEYKK